MKQAAHGLVIGKFYPPHAGHHLLVRAAAERSERVTVVVMAANVESISLAERVAWMREAHADDANVTVTGIMDDLPVDFESDEIWRGHVALMLEAARSVTARAVDCVFSSEPYGEELARRLSARHVLVDQARARVPMSGTAVRTNPAAAWPFLAPPVRRGLALRVVLVGAESTGKTTLAGALAAALRKRGQAFSATTWVAEYGRELTLEKLALLRDEATLAGKGAPDMADVVWQTEDFVRVAHEQNRREHEAASHAPILIADTDAFATSLWHERYLSRRAAEVDALSLSSARRLYLLTHHDDVPFEQDGVRDGEHIRAWMTSAFVTRLEREQRCWQWLRGASLESRLARALALISDFERVAWTFAAPPG